MLGGVIGFSLSLIILRFVADKWIWWNFLGMLVGWFVGTVAITFIAMSFDSDEKGVGS